MRIEATSGIGSARVTLRGRRRVAPATATPGTADRDRERPDGRALVVAEPDRERGEPAARLIRLRIHAPFIAQLAALRDEAPTSRRPRRIEPGRAAALYADAMDGPGLLVPGFLVDVAR